MPLKEHPNYKDELRRLKETIEYVGNAIKAVEMSKDESRKEIKEAFIELDYLDSSLSYSTIMLHATLYADMEKKYKGLIRAEDKPYFARIDLIADGKKEVDQLYIGKMSLFRPDWDIPMILDWRAPLASVYYDGKLGDVSYQTETDTLRGELILKRQFTIEKGELMNMMDIDITTTDTFLQASLEDHKDNRLKEIVSTIQAEQNAIIRADINKPLIVQGVAGSGKTTIALHRIAYLIYTYEKSFYPENFLILAPNRLFLNYISEVLPELGVDRVNQTTYIDYMFDLLGKKYKLVNPDEKLLNMIDHKDDNKGLKTYELVKGMAEFKGSITFKNMIERYIQDIENDFVPTEDFVLDGYTLMTAETINQMFLGYTYLPVYKRIDQVKKLLQFRLKNEKKKILENIEINFDKQIDYLRLHVFEDEDRRLKIVDLIDKRDHALLTIQKSSNNLVKKYMTGFPQRELLHYYQELISHEETFTKYMDEEIDSQLIAYICGTSRQIFNKNHIELEDIAALSFLKHKLFGFEKEIDIRYVVIDEAQDYSHFQIAALKEILGTELFTILGDLSQGIHSYRGIKNWNYLLKNIFNEDKSQYLTLTQSYRTTIEIMDMANEIIQLCPLEDLILAQPVVRHGEKPRVYAMASNKEILEAVKIKLAELLQENYHSVAIIGKSPKECKHIHVELEKRYSIHTKLLDNKEDRYDQSIVVVPSYLAKGLEFDAVIIVNLDDAYEENELDIKLLYVAMTRALHKMDVFYKKGTNKVFDQLN